MKKWSFALCVWLFVFLGTALADDAADAVDLVNQAIASLETQGLVRTFEQINSKIGMFTTANGLYVFVYYLDGTMAAHYNEELVGQNLLNKPDAEGKLFRKEIITKAKENGECWVDYTYREKASGKTTKKTTYCRMADDFVFCCGITK